MHIFISVTLLQSIEARADEVEKKLVGFITMTDSNITDPNSPNRSIINLGAFFSPITVERISNVLVLCRHSVSS